MMKRFSTLLLIMALVLCLPVSAADYDARSYILMEASTGRVLLEENADEALPPASVTKIMTLLLIMEAVADGRLKWDEMVQTSEYAASMGGSQVFLEPGEEMPVSEMVKCVVVASANDAAVALAEKVAGSEEAFVKRMNERAAELGMTNTVFLNTNGLDDGIDGHVTSARDIAIMSRELITKHPQILELSSIWMDTIRDGAFGLTNTNRLVRFYRGANGLKTGSTSKAKFCISATAERDGMQLIAVVMASPTRDARNETAKKLLDYGFANYEAVTLGAKTLPETLTLVGGVTDTVKIAAAQQPVVLEKGQSSRISENLVLPEEVNAPVEAGDELGYVEFLLDGESLLKIPVVAVESAKRIGFTELFWYFMKCVLMVGL